MATLPELLLEQGIRPHRYKDGNQKILCPRCSRVRKNRTDRCLSLCIDGGRALWNCHHCQWRGVVSEWDDERQASRPQRRVVAPVKPTAVPDSPTPDVLRWLPTRGISEVTAGRNKLVAARRFV